MDLLNRNNKHIFLEKTDLSSNSFISNVNSVASVASSIPTIISSIDDIRTCNNNIEDINTVADDISNVNIVASGMDNISSIISSYDTIDSVYDSLSTISSVNSMSSTISSVNNIKDDIVTVAGIADDLDSVSSGLTNQMETLVPKSWVDTNAGSSKIPKTPSNSVLLSDSWLPKATASNVGVIYVTSNSYISGTDYKTFLDDSTSTVTGYIATTPSYVSSYTNSAITDALSSYMVSSSITNYVASTVSNYLPITGGTISGSLIFNHPGSGGSGGIGNANNCIRVKAGSLDAGSAGAMINLYTSGTFSSANSFELIAKNVTSEASSSCILLGKPDGTLTWGGKAIEYGNSVASSESQYYVKYNTGMMIEWGNKSITSASILSITYEEPFASSATVSIAHNAGPYVSIGSATNTRFSVAASASAYPIDLRWIAIGKA